MTRKHFVKLMMAEGVSKNRAQSIACIKRLSEAMSFGDAT